MYGESYLDKNKAKITEIFTSLVTVKSGQWMAFEILRRDLIVTSASRKKPQITAIRVSLFVSCLLS